MLIIKKKRIRWKMLAYIKGTLEIKMTDYVVIDVGGLGYKWRIKNVWINIICKWCRS